MIRMLRRLQQRSFEGANKPGTFLAQQLKKQKERSLINRTEVAGKEVNNLKNIKEAFLQFYSNLYKERSIVKKLMIITNTIN